jgi:hypothetical protein
MVLFSFFITCAILVGVKRVCESMEEIESPRFYRKRGDGKGGIEEPDPEQLGRYEVRCWVTGAAEQVGEDVVKGEEAAERAGNGSGI